MTDKFNPRAILDVLKRVLPDDGKTASLHEPCFTGNEWSYVKECLDTGWVSSAGKFVDRFERGIAEFTGVKYAIAVVNGTAALHVCLKLVGVNPGDEVLVPALTFVATANAVVYCGATPHFVDSELKTLGMDPAKLAAHLESIAEIREDGCYNKHTGRRIKAAIPMHAFGHPVDMDPLNSVCKRFKVEVIEDAAESLGSYYKGVHTGSHGKISALSFNGNKVITTGGGGAILTNDVDLGKLAKHITTTARLPHPWNLTHDMVGYNYRLPNINAALGCAQLECLEDFLAKKRALAKLYETSFAPVRGVVFFTEQKISKSNYWLNVLLIDEENADQRDDILKLLNENRIQSRPAWDLMHKLHMYSQCPRMDLSVAENISRRLINIPSSAFLMDNR